jgi:small subunit ribosomal protein S9
MKIMEPIILAGDLVNKVDINVRVRGGGVMGQAEATRMAIGRGLLEYSGDIKLKEILHDYDKTIIKGDHRRKEPKKYGGIGARAKKQKSYR